MYEYEQYMNYGYIFGIMKFLCYSVLLYLKHECDVVSISIYLQFVNYCFYYGVLWCLDFNIKMNKI